MSEGEKNAVGDLYGTFLSPAKITLIAYILLLYTRNLLNEDWVVSRGVIRYENIGE